MSERDTPRNRMILALVIGITSGIIVVVLAIVQFFDMTVREEMFKKELSVKPIARRDLETKEQRTLTAYQWINQKVGQVRVPTARARELLLREWDGRKDGLVEGSDANLPPAQPATAPASGGAAPAPGGAAPAAPGGAAPAP